MFRRSEGTARRIRSSPPMTNPPATPMAEPRPRRVTRPRKPAPTSPAVDASANSNATTARMAPTGSMSTPSASRMVRRLLRRRIRRVSGLITVGPVTETSAPNSNAMRRLQPSASIAVTAAPAIVTTAPSVISRRIVSASRRSRSRLSCSAPSKRITATASPTMGLRPSPSVSGRTMFANSGPRRMPVASRKRIPGTRACRASDCATTPAVTARAKVRAGSWRFTKRRFAPSRGGSS